MNKDLQSLLYTLAIAGGVLAAATLAAWSWPMPLELKYLVLMPGLVAFVFLAGRFPIELSRQAPASLATVPIFVAVLLLHPGQAGLIAAVGTLLSEMMLKAPSKAIAFNVTVNAAAGVLAGIVFLSLSPVQGPLELTAVHMLAAVASGLVLQSTNVLLVIGMVTLRKGPGFWRLWRETYAFEAMQEGALLTVGLIAAVLYAVASWSVVLVLIPSLLAYYGFKRNVGEAADKSRMAEELEQRLKELKELQAQLIQSAKLASVGMLAAGVAHEINNPVFAIIGRAEILLKNPERYLRSERAQSYTKTIYEMGERIAQIVSQLLDYFRSSEEREPIRIVDAMEAALSLLGESAESKRVTITREFDEVPPVIAVSAQLQQVFVNLLSNALDASDGPGAITVGCRVDGTMIETYVKDIGVGVPEELRGVVFEPPSSPPAPPGRSRLRIDRAGTARGSTQQPSWSC